MNDLKIFRCQSRSLHQTDSIERLCTATGVVHPVTTQAPKAACPMRGCAFGHGLNGRQQEVSPSPAFAHFGANLPDSLSVSLKS